MFKKILQLLLLSALSSTFSQVQYLKFFEKNYDELPLKVRIDNSGIYAISSFDVRDDTICLNSFDDHISYNFYKNTFGKVFHESKLSKDFVLDFKNDQNNLLRDKVDTHLIQNLKLKKVYLSNAENLFVDEDGILSNKDGERIILSVKNRNELKLDFAYAKTKLLLKDFNPNIHLEFASNLACADFIGIDSSGNIFLLIETFVSDIPLKIQREVYAISKRGEVLSILEIPSIKYLYTVRDFQIDEEGNLYHLLCDDKKVTIIKWCGLTKSNGEKINYPSEYNYSIHFNDFVTTVEAPTETENQKEALASRVEALRLGEKYVLYKYNCSGSNLAPNGVVAPDGDTVKTPSWLITGYNARIPYKWGGFSSLTDFTNGLTSGKYAGDIDTDESSSYAVGVDCSGFVSRCWQMTYHASTSYMPAITTQYASWDSLKPADAIHKVGHVRLFIERTSNGSFRVVESAGRNWDVSYWTFTLSDLATYTPRYYNNMTNDYSKQQPELISALVQSSGKTKLSWTCDTTNIKGYRLYSSTDGANWILIQNEISLQTRSLVVNRNNNAEYYRVSSVLNNSPTFSESPWSNVLGIGEYLSTKRVLIVDGFKRKNGSWRGTEHTFATRYGKVLQAFSLDFESVQNNLVEDNSIDLNNYEAIYWILGDESTEDETFSSTEQVRVKNYLENGGKLFVSGSEIGWDLYEKGSNSDKTFYNQYLRATYIADNATSNIANGVNGSCFSGLNLNFGQTYYEDYPDEINTNSGSTLCMKYSNNKGAGITHSGTFGSSSNIGKIIYLAFPLETTSNDSAFNAVISNSLKFFFSGSVKIIVEGLYDPSLNRFNRRDTIKAYLRNLSQPYAIVDSASAIIDSITFSCNFGFIHAPTGNYYLVIKHRNSIETWSKPEGISLIKGISPNYNFSDVPSRAYGNNLKMVGSYWCIYSGDVIQDGSVDLSDVIAVINDANTFVTGAALSTDLTGDESVDLSDIIIVANNANAFVSKQTPEVTSCEATPLMNHDTEIK